MSKQTPRVEEIDGWDRQERAMASVREAGPQDADGRDYQLLMRALAAEPDEQPPHDFARHVAEAAETSLAAKRPSLNLELPILCLLGAMLFALLVVNLLAYGPDLYKALSSSAGTTCLGLLLAVALVRYLHRGENPVRST